MVTPLILVAAEEETHNPLIPSIPDLVWGSVCFVIVLFFFWKYALPKLQKTLDERSALIEGNIEKAEQAEAAAAAALDAYNSQLREAKEDASRIREAARAEGQQILSELKTQAQAESNRIVDNARSQIDADRKAAFAELKSEVGLLAVDLASNVVGESLEDDVRSKAVVDRFLSQLDGASK